MSNNGIKNISAAIDYMEAHLTEKLDLDIVADAVHYSKYHLHRMFTNAVGLTIHDYLQRRQLTEAAKLLVFPINQFLILLCFQDMKANNHSLIFLQQCINNLLTNIERMRSSIHYN